VKTSSMSTSTSSALWAMDGHQYHRANDRLLFSDPLLPLSLRIT